jgi:Ala-tRNA(Pro) deacylase
MPIRKLKEFLEANRVKFMVIGHSTAYTTLEAAESAHISGRELAKTVIVKINGKMAMVVLPASHNIDFDRFKETSGFENIELANEDDFMDLFRDCEIGAMPPFGNLYGMKVFVEPSLAEDKEIAFNAGNHRELIKMSFEDFDKLVRPEHLNFSCRLTKV